MLVSEAEWNGLQETSYLLRNPRNAERLMESLAQARAGETREKDLSDLEALIAGENSGDA